MDDINQNTKELISKTIKKMVGFMNLDCQVELKEEEDDRRMKTIFTSVYAPENARILIGKNGQNLKALEHLVRAVILKHDGEFKSIVVDINDYKKSRATYITDLAKQVVTRVRNTQKSEALLPMTAYERRIVHTELASYPDISTESTGDDLRRRVVIKPYP
jgi:spoIIIJ-associated protein